MSERRGIYAVDPEELERVEYGSEEQLATEIYNWVMEPGHHATIHTEFGWWSKAVVSPYVGDASNWSIGISEKISLGELFYLLEEKGLSISIFVGFPNWVVVDSVETGNYPPITCILPEE